jgi:hypothetical protein
LYNGEPGVISVRFESKYRLGSWRAKVEEMKIVMTAVNERERRIMAGNQLFGGEQVVYK